MITSKVRVEVSQFVKRELHSLVNHMHSNLKNEQVTSTIARHFSNRVRDLALNRGLHQLRMFAAANMMSATGGPA